MKFGLIGEHLQHSYSQQIHERLANYSYELHPLLPHELEDFILHAEYQGINVTIPYKKAVIPFLHELSPEAARIGSVNTIVREGERLVGYNTDYSGFTKMTERAGISFSNRRVLILGTGGTSVMAQAAAADGNAAGITVVSRRGRVNYTNIHEQKDAEIIINTTPVGMYPNNDDRLLELERFPKLTGVLDVVYNPLRTNLVCDARKLGIKAMGGLPMLVYQAVFASELFTKKRVEEKTSERVLREMYQQAQNIVLIGMPGSGKTTAGQALALSMGRTFIDTDELIEEKANKTIPQIFAQQGEAEFRKLEHDCIAQSAKSSGVVIATGGGAVLNSENMRALARNGRIYYLQCDTSMLSTEGRPLSSGETALEVLYQQRHPLYTSFSDVSVNRNDPRGPTLAIKEEFHEAAGY